MKRIADFYKFKEKKQSYYQGMRVTIICLTCQVINEEILPAGGIIYRDDVIILHHCLDINIAGYFILSPIRHVESLENVTQNELFQMMLFAKRITEILTCEADIDKVYILSLGEETSHLHLHLFPRYKWMLDFSDENIRTTGKIDGAKLFSFIRNQYKINKQERYESRHLTMIAQVKETLLAE